LYPIPGDIGEVKTSPLFHLDEKVFEIFDKIRLNNWFTYLQAAGSSDILS
jgi:hypothetical protein